MRIYHDHDADLAILRGKQIAVLGYGNQGRAQALNLRDSGLEVVIGNRDDPYAQQARDDDFRILPIPEAIQQAQIAMILIPDEVTPQVFGDEMQPHLSEGDTLVFASGYNIAFGAIVPPSSVDMVLVAPRMIGAGVREHYLSGLGFPSFFAVAQDPSGQAKETALAIAKGIGSTRFGAVEVTFAQEAELDLFTEQCFGPAFGQVLMTAVDILLEQGYPPEAVLLELYMSGEFAYTLSKITELGMVEQTRLHSRTSQYGSMSRGLRFMIPELRARMDEGLQEIRSGNFAREWEAEQLAGCPTLEALRSAAQGLPLNQMEAELRRALGRAAPSVTESVRPIPEQKDQPLPSQPSQKLIAAAPHARCSPDIMRSPMEKPWDRFWARFKRQSKPDAEKAPTSVAAMEINKDRMEQILRRFTLHLSDTPALREFAENKQILTHYHLEDIGQEFYIDFHLGQVRSGLGAPAEPADIHLELGAKVLDGMLTGETNPMRAAMSGKLRFRGDAKVALGIQPIQNDLVQIYCQARSEALDHEKPGSSGTVDR